MAVKVLVLDATPLGLLVPRSGYAPADTCRQWLARHLAAGTRVLVPEIIDYELRRELLRINKTRALSALDAFNGAEPDRYLALTTAAIRLAADLWAQARRRGLPTSDPHALDVDVILAAQALATGLPPGDFLVATANVAHLSQFVPAELWSRI
jgi:predicted nucleic acid-binding protein